MKRFAWRELTEALAYATAGEQALHLHRILTPGAPRCFVRAVERGDDIAHLFDRDALRLHATARRLGVRVVLIERHGTPTQHVDLCLGPLERALLECDPVLPLESAP